MRSATHARKMLTLPQETSILYLMTFKQHLREYFSERSIRAAAKIPKAKRVDRAKLAADARWGSSGEYPCHNCGLVLRSYRQLKIHRNENPPCKPKRGRPKKGTSVGTSPAARYAKKFREENPEKVLAHKELRLAVRKGLMDKPDKCSICKTKCVPSGHHEDYDLPLDVLWCCAKCHRMIHLQKAILDQPEKGAQSAAQKDRWAKKSRAAKVRMAKAMAKARWAGKPPVKCPVCGMPHPSLRALAKHRMKSPQCKTKRGRPKKKKD